MPLRVELETMTARPLGEHDHLSLGNSVEGMQANSVTYLRAVADLAAVNGIWVTVTGKRQRLITRRVQEVLRP